MGRSQRVNAGQDMSSERNIHVTLSERSESKGLPRRQSPSAFPKREHDAAAVRSCPGNTQVLGQVWRSFDSLRCSEHLRLVTAEAPLLHPEGVTDCSQGWSEPLRVQRAAASGTPGVRPTLHKAPEGRRGRPRLLPPLRGLRSWVGVPRGCARGRYAAALAPPRATTRRPSGANDVVLHGISADVRRLSHAAPRATCSSPEGVPKARDNSR